MERCRRRRKRPQPGHRVQRRESVVIRRRAGVPGMIMTSYTSLVVESHRRMCAGVLSSVAGRVRRKSRFDRERVTRQNDIIALASFASPVIAATETGDLVRTGQGKYRGAA